jgi:hypothetical protein
VEEGSVARGLESREGRGRGLGIRWVPQGKRVKKSRSQGRTMGRRKEDTKDEGWLPVAHLVSRCAMAKYFFQMFFQ